MDKQQLLGYFQDHYLSRQDVLFKLPLNISIDSFWQDLVNQRKARATMLTLYSANGQPYWFVTTDRMVKASERLCEEAMRHDSFFDPYRIPLSQALTSALSQEAYFTSYVEGADYPLQDAIDFLRRGEEPVDAYEQNILNNYQAGSYLLSALSIPFDEAFVKELVMIISDGQGNYRTTDTTAIPAMEGEQYAVPPAHLLPDRMGQFFSFLADIRVHPLIKAAVGQAYILTTRPFPEANERLARLISNAVLLRYGYDFFLDISISSYIARESFRYFKAMREIIRSENDGDLTYFVEYFLELLVRALDGARLEEQERMQSQLESERKMALQPLKQPTVQYAQPAVPHPVNPEAIVKVIDNAVAIDDMDEEDIVPQVSIVPSKVILPPPDEPQSLLQTTLIPEVVRTEKAIAQAVRKPVSPPLPAGDASFRASQSQAGSTQADKTAAEITTPHPPGGSCPQLLGQPFELLEKIKLMLENGKITFAAADWATIHNMHIKKAAYECRQMHIIGLADREQKGTAYFYSFRFSSAEFDEAIVCIDSSCGGLDDSLALLEKSQVDSVVKSAQFIRYRIASGSLRFLVGALRDDVGLSKQEANDLAQLFIERGILHRCSNRAGDYEIHCADATPHTPSKRKTMQADVASPKQGFHSILPSPALAKKLALLEEGNSPCDKRISETLSALLQQGLEIFTSEDWCEVSGIRKSCVSKDITRAMDYGLIKRYDNGPSRYHCSYVIQMNPDASIRWDGLGEQSRTILRCIIQAFADRPFTISEAVEILNRDYSALAKNIRSLALKSILRHTQSDSRRGVYVLNVPLDEAIRQAETVISEPLALVG